MIPAVRCIALSALLQLPVFGPRVAAALRLGHDKSSGEDPRLQCIVHQDATVPKKKKALRPSVCERFPKSMMGYMGTDLLPLLGESWGEGLDTMYPIKTQEDFERAAEPAGYKGARLRLREWALRLVAGESLEVAVLGGSMTKGPAPRDQPGERRGETWAPRLEHFMRSLGHNITVHNLAKHATGAEYAASHVVYEQEAMNTSSLIIIDTSVNDLRDWFLTPDATGGGDIYDVLVQELLELPQRPAIIDLETFHVKGIHGLGNWYPGFCTEHLDQFVHSTAEKFLVPMVSFPDAICQGGSNSWWFGNLHPNTTTHDLIARTLVGVLGLEMERACAVDGLSVPDHPQLPLKHAAYMKCLKQGMRLNNDFTKQTSTEQGDAFILQQDEWQFARDLPNKPFGWLALGNISKGSTITFKTNASAGGWMRLDYLSTYENIGSVTCWPGGFEPGDGCYINAIMDGAQFSVTRSAYIGLPADKSATTLVCSANGGKFKVLGVASC